MNAAKSDSVISNAAMLISFAGYTNLLKRRYEEAIEVFLSSQCADGPSAASCTSIHGATRSGRTGRTGRRSPAIAAVT